MRHLLVVEGRLGLACLHPHDRQTRAKLGVRVGLRRFGRSADYAIIQTTAAESLHLDSDRFPARHAARERLQSGQTWMANGVTVLYRVWRTHLFTKPGAGRVLQTRFHAEETCLAVKPRPRRRPAGPRVVVCCCPPAKRAGGGPG